MEYSSLETNYRHIIRLLNEALKQWHPDVNKDEGAAFMARWLIQAKARFEQCYRLLKEGGAYV